MEMRGTRNQIWATRHPGHSPINGCDDRKQATTSDCAIAENGIVSDVMARSSDNSPTPESFLPLHRDTFQILVSLADADRHGYAILQDVADRTGDARSITPSTLYSSIRRLLESGLIKELHDRPNPKDDDSRRRYYRLTSLGRRVAELEALRLERLLRDARQGGLLPKRS